MNNTAETLELIEVPIADIARPTHSLIVADSKFLASLKTVESTVAAFKITDAVSLQAAADLQTRLTGAGGLLERTRVQLKAPYLALNKMIDAAAQPVQARIDLAKRALSVMQVNYSAEQRRLAEEAERNRQAELRRLEQIRLQEEAAAKKKADEIAEQVRLKNEAATKLAEQARIAGLPVVQAVEEECWDAPEPVVVMKSETEVAIDRLKYAPVAAPVKAQGVREVVTLFPHLVDINLVPEPFITKTLKLAAIQATFCRSFKKGDKIPECSGIRFEVQESTVATGKGAF